MLTIVLKILSIIGVLLLALLLLVLVVLLLVLFVPVTYHISGAKDTEGFRINGKMKWLLGLLRIRFVYPEPGELTAKLLFFTLFKTKIPPEKEQEKNEDSSNAITVPAVGEESCSTTIDNTENKIPGTEPDVPEDSITENEPPPEESPSFFEKISQKFEKIKYTIQSIYDKIKGIWDTISYYLELLREEETKQLLSHIWLRSGKILKSIRPRHIRAQILFGAASPDTTGYLYGGYCMLAPMLGGEIQVTPDFERAVLEADFAISGHITIWTLAINVGRIALDKRLWHLLRKVKGSAAKAEDKEKADKKAA